MEKTIKLKKDRCIIKWMKRKKKALEKWINMMLWLQD